MELIISRSGDVTALYGEAIDLAQLGSLAIRRASRVEPDAAGAWWADLSLSGGPLLGPFRGRTAALEAEARWLRLHVLGASPAPG